MIHYTGSYICYTTHTGKAATSQRFFMNFFALLEKLLTTVLSENVSGSSSSAHSLWSDQPVEPLSPFELSPPDSIGELGSSGMSRYKCFSMKRAVSSSLQ